jgi:hypothetical protein
VSVVDSGSGHSNGVLTFSGGSPSRAAVVRVEVYPANGSIRRVTIIDPGLYFTTPTAVLNTTPVSISSIVANTANYYGQFITGGYLVFSGGNPVREANVKYEVGANGVINSITINDVGLYRSTPTATPNVTPVSITEVYPTEPGLGYVNGNVIFTTSQGTANITANATVTVNGTGAISSIVINTVGLYANGADVIVYGILNPATNTVQSPTYPASFRIGYAANTLNVANLVVTTTANNQQTASVTITANSNTYTNASFSVVAVPNVETSAVITVGFTGRNTAANVAIEVYDNSSGLLPPSNTVNGEIVKLTINSPGNYYYTPNVTPNSAGSGALITFNPVSWYQTANAQTAIIFN